MDGYQITWLQCNRVVYSFFIFTEVILNTSYPCLVHTVCLSEFVELFNVIHSGW